MYTIYLQRRRRERARLVGVASHHGAVRYAQLELLGGEVLVVMVMGERWMDVWVRGAKVEGKKRPPTSTTPTVHTV